MDLATFGAVLRFAMDLEARAENFHDSVGDATGREHARKRVRMLEQARREGVAEMILEPITGLDTSSYPARIERHEDVGAFEEVCARFYGDAAEKLPIREVVRLFRRLAVDHEAAARCGDAEGG